MSDKNQTTKHRDESIELIRVIATILVVLGHSGFYAISTAIPEMGINWYDRISDTSYFSHLAKIITALIYSFHMQLFFALSGIVLAICIERGKYKDFAGFVKNKGKRLLIPYIGVTLLYNIPILDVSGYFSKTDQSLIWKNVGLYLVGYGKNHLWFLVSLFIIFVITHKVCLRIMRGDKMTAISSLLVATVMYLLGQYTSLGVVELFYFDRILKYSLWFLVGVFLYKNRLRIYKMIRKHVLLSVILFLSIWLGCFWLSERSTATLLKEVGKICSAAFGIFLTCTISIELSSKFFFAKSRLFNMLDEKSLTIYLYGPMVNYLIIDAMLLMKPIWKLNSIQSALLYIFRFTLQIVISILIGMALAGIKRMLRAKIGDMK